MTADILAADGGTDQLQVWLPALATVVVSLIAAVFGPNWLNRRNATQITKATASKDEATAAQAIQAASVSLIEEWRRIATDTQTEAARADARADEAERVARQAEARADAAQRRADEAEYRMASMASRIAVLEEQLRRAGIAPP